MNSTVLLLFVLGYFLLLLLVAFFTSRKSNNESFFIGNKNSNWMLVAFGMIGTSLSGVTFVSVPGGVGSGSFYYFQLVLGYILGYLVIAYMLLPLYYKLNVTSIYAYLENRFGTEAHKIGASFFILSRTIGATARLYLVINILQIFILDNLQIPLFNTVGIPFWVTALIILILILLYTFEGGVKTIVYTDTLQTTGMLVGLVVCIFAITKAMNVDFSEALNQIQSKGYSRIFNTDIKAPSFFLKHILGGMFIAIAMTGLDQEMMQKNISVKKLKDSQKNIMSFASVLVVVNLLFLFLGGVLYIYAAKNNIKASPDDLFPTIALSNTFNASIGIIFIIALISALFPSVDGAITSLTSSYCIDILNINSLKTSDKEKKQQRLKVHLTFAVIFFILVLIFKAINDKLIIDFILKFAGITYGPLLGLFAFGILTKKQVKSNLLWTICIIAPLLCLSIDVINNPQFYEQKLHIKLGLDDLSHKIFNGYKIGYDLIIVNGIITFGLLTLIKQRVIN